jgi:hypothetical protein
MASIEPITAPEWRGDNEILAWLLNVIGIGHWDF